MSALTRSITRRITRSITRTITGIGGGSSPTPPAGAGLIPFGLMYIPQDLGSSAPKVIPFGLTFIPQ